MSVLEIKNLHVSIEEKEILKGVNLTMKTGEIHAIMGPNGTGKSTLSAAIMGNPNYEVTEGEILFDGKNVLDLEVDERARLGLFLAMQYPSEIPGITNAEFMRAAINAKRDENDKISVMAFLKKLDEKMALLKMPEEMADIDALKVVAKGVNEMRGDTFGALIITHYQRLLNYITPDVVHIMMEGRVVMTGNADLAKRLEAEGYAGISKELGIDYKEEEA